MSDTAIIVIFFGGLAMLTVAFFVWWIVGAVNEMQELFGRGDKQ